LTSTRLVRRLTWFGVPLALAACGGGGEPTAPPTFTLQVTGAAPASVVAGSSFGDSIRVRVVDGGGNPKAGTSVVFAVTAGAGSVSPASAVSDAQGRAAARFVTDPKIGVNTASASITGSAPVAFTITTIAGPAKSLAIKERILIVDAGQRVNPTITAVDSNGNAVPNTQIDFTARTQSVVSVTSDGGIVGTGLAETFVVASSPFASDSVLVVVTTPGGPVLQSDFSRLDLARDTSFTVPIVLDMRTSGEKLGATTITIRWNTSQLTMVSQVDGSSGVGAFVNANNVSQGVLTLAAASAAGFSGRVELRRITFKAAPSPGVAGQLQLSASELSGAGTFTNLLSKTTAVVYPLSTR
jgi:hypothetical protein